MQDYFFVRREKQYEQVNFDAIIYVKGKNNYIQIVTEQRTFLVMNSLTEVKKFLPDHLFCRIHYSYIVSLARVKAFDLSRAWLHEAADDKPYKMGLARITELPVGLRFRGELRKAVNIMSYKGGSHSKSFVNIM